MLSGQVRLWQFKIPFSRVETFNSFLAVNRIGVYDEWSMFHHKPYGWLKYRIGDFREWIKLRIVRTILTITDLHGYKSPGIISSSGLVLMKAVSIFRPSAFAVSLIVPTCPGFARTITRQSPSNA